jgi:hypothetical protein
VDARHNISPRLQKQLILELEVGVGVAELVEALLGGVVIRQTAPLDQHLLDPAMLLSLQRALRGRKHAVVQHWWQGSRGG